MCGTIRHPNKRKNSFFGMETRSHRCALGLARLRLGDGAALTPSRPRDRTPGLVAPPRIQVSSEDAAQKARGKALACRSFVRSFVCCTCTCTHARVRAHAFAHAKARSADLSSNLPKVAARKSCVQLLPPHMGDTVPLLKPHPIYEGILGTLYAHRRAAATRRTSSHSTPPRTGVPPW